MNRLFLTIPPLSLLVAAQSAVAMPTTTVGGHQIPTAQAMPPAGHNDLGFRPACTQLQEIGQANGLTAWAISLPDGGRRVLAEYEPMATSLAYSYLDASGLCKVGGADVPIVWASQLPQRSTARPTASVVAPNPIDEPSTPWWRANALSILAGLAMAGYVANRACAYYRPFSSGDSEPESLPEAQEPRVAATAPAATAAATSAESDFLADILEG